MKTQCDICHQPFPDSALIELDGKLLCVDCEGEYTTHCAHCDTQIWASDNAGSDALPLCRGCRDQNYDTCYECEALIPNGSVYYDDDNDRAYCSSCYHDLPSRDAIHDYYYKPDPLFYGTGPRYFGVELELDGGGECSSSAQQMLDIMNREEEFAYFKHDGSLDDGMEIVTHPLSLDYQLNQFPWEKVCQKAIALGYLSHQASTCGLHIHISRNAFGKTEEEQDTSIARVLYFFEKNWEELLKFSRRTQRQLDRWATRYGYKDQPKEILDIAKKGYHSGRYTCINLQNHDTVEFRMFRGTLKPNTLFATLQMLNRICDVALFMSDDEVKAMAWTTFASGCKAPELVQYLKERQLYVNDKVEMEGEI